MLKIRHAIREDAPTTLDIRRQAIQQLCTSAYSAEQIARWSQVELSEDYRDWVARDYYLALIHDQAIATGALNPSIGDIDGLFVHPDFARQGIARAMLEHLETQARHAGLSHVQLRSTLNAQGFYRHCGFTGEQQAIYHSRSGLQLACVPMHKALS